MIGRPLLPWLEEEPQSKRNMRLRPAIIDLCTGAIGPRRSMTVLSLVILLHSAGYDKGNGPHGKESQTE